MTRYFSYGLIGGGALLLLFITSVANSAWSTCFDSGDRSECAETPALRKPRAILHTEYGTLAIAFTGTHAVLMGMLTSPGACAKWEVTDTLEQEGRVPILALDFISARQDEVCFLENAAPPQLLLWTKSERNPDLRYRVRVNEETVFEGDLWQEQNVPAGSTVL